MLDQAVALRRRLDAAAIAFGTGAAAGKIAMVVGQAPFTPGGYVVGEAGLEYVGAAGGGDGRVALAEALLPGVRTWTLDAPHGELAGRIDAFPAYLELLATGETRLLEPLDRSSVATGDPGLPSPDVPAPAHSRPSRGLLASQPPSSGDDVFGAVVRPGVDDRRADSALHVSVLNGDLKFVHQPLMVGHYRSLLLTGTEGVVDRLVGGAMSKSLSAGLYPDGPGSHQVFGNIRRDPDNVLAMARPLAVVVAGLGEEGKLRAADLSTTVRQAVLAYAQRLAEQEQGAPAEFEIATTLIGSGGTGISAGSSAQLIAQGVFDASVKLREKGWPQIGRLIFVEIYLDRASDAWRALEVQSTSTQQLKVVGPVFSGAGALRRSLDSSYRGAAYDFITAVTSQRADGEPTITYTLDTRRARTEVRAQQAQGTLVRDLVARASNDANRDAQIGRTLFDLLVPVEMEPFLGGTTEMVIELDAGTAAIPWELLDTPGSQDAGGDHRPWAIRSKLLRKLRTADFRAQPSDAAADGSVLVVGEPLVDAALYPPLPGALAEANAVVARLTAGAAGIDAAHVRALVSGADDARSVINALFERPYRIVHVAGHGAPGPKGGVVLSGDSYLGPAEVAAMRTVPELVFLNCCHLAARDPQTTLVPYDRAGFAANIAEALIEIGVRCVVAAGWAVEDEPAALFATTFYDALFGGGRFIDAVAAARAAAWRAGPDGNTWAAYQCYGDPGWTWHRNGSGMPRAAVSPQDEFAAVSSAPALALALENISIRLRFGGDESKGDASRQGQRDRIRYLESTFAPLWGAMGAVAEAFGLAFADARDLDKAVAWYRTAVAAADGSASFRAAEQLGNQLARRGEASADALAGRRDIEEGIAVLSALVAVQTTAERESLLGAAWKRMVMLEGRGPASVAALRAMALHYGNAERLARTHDADNLFYPAKNGIGADLRLAFLERRPAELALERIEAVRASLERAATQRPDFWVVVGQIELRMLTSLAASQLAAGADALIGDYESLKTRVPAPGMWDSVHTDARFTIEPYLAVASAAEKKAATRLLDALAAMASP